MKTCQKHSFALCLKIIFNMQQQSLLDNSQSQELMDEVE